MEIFDDFGGDDVRIGEVGAVFNKKISVDLSRIREDLALLKFGDACLRLEH